MPRFFLYLILLVSFALPVQANEPFRALLEFCQQTQSRVSRKELLAKSDVIFPNPLWYDLVFPPLGGKLAPKPLVPSTRGVLAMSDDMSLADRQKAVGAFRVADLVVKAGHNPVRSKEKIIEIAESFKTEGYRPASEQKDRTVINVRTHQNGAPKAIELLEGHHRLLAFFRNGITKISDLPQEDLDIWVNGTMPDGTLGFAKYPAHALPFQLAYLWEPASSHRHAVTSPKPDWYTQPNSAFLHFLVTSRRIGLRIDKPAQSGELALSMRMDNYDIGSRSTLRDVYDASFRDYQPNVGRIHFHEHPPSLAEINSRVLPGMEEVLLVPNKLNIGNPALVGKMNEVLEKQGASYRLNLYQYGIPYRSYVKTFGQESFERRLLQIYNTTQWIQELPND